MSYSSLWGIKENFKGEEITSYHNSWWFAPVVWSVLQEKYLHTMSGLLRGETFNVLNNAINECDNISDRIVWDLSSSCIFFTKDAEKVAESIKVFMKNNGNYDVIDGIGVLQQDHIVERFNDIANDILEYKDGYKFFVFKGTSVDDNVESWFWDYENDCECALKEDIKADVVVIQDDTIDYLYVKDVYK